MSLTRGSGPFGEHPAGSFDFAHPKRVLYVEPSPRRVRAFVGGEVVADSERALLVHETGRLPVYYFPREDVREALLRGTERHEERARSRVVLQRVIVGRREIDDAAWIVEAPGAGAERLAGHVAFEWDAMDEWREEDEEVFVHPRDPYHRVDALRSSRHVVVRLEGEVLADTQRPVMLFETGLSARAYVPLGDVHRGRLVPSETTTVCPYKGVATYFAVRVGAKLHPDVAFTFRSPRAAATAIAGLVAFDHARVEVTYGESRVTRQPSPSRS